MYNRRDLNRVTLTTEPPSAAVVRAHNNRNMLMCPDRRCFIQSMPTDQARQIGGNGVPHIAQHGQMYSYTFPAQREQQSPYGNTTNFYSAPRNHESQVRRGTPSREYDPGTYASRSAARSGTPSRRPQGGSYIDVDRSRR